MVRCRPESRARGRLQRHTQRSHTLRTSRLFRPGAGRTPARLAVVASAVAAVVGAGLLPLANAADAQSPSTAPKSVKPSVEQLCSAPKPGDVACFALRRTDVGGADGVQAAA